MLQSDLYLPTSGQVRAAIEAIEDRDYLMPSPSKKFPNGVRRIPGKLVKMTDRLALLGGFRISEVVTKFSGDKGNSSLTMNLWVDTHKATGEEVLRIQVNALKKYATTSRDLGIPLSPQHEPLSKMVLEAWEAEDGNPCRINRQMAWYVNSQAFKGMGYKVGSQLIYERDENRRMVKDENGKPKIAKKIEEHIKKASDHFLRHIRAIELRDLQLTPEERVSFFKWSARGVGMNQMLMTYSQPDWFEYFPKFLSKRLG